MLKNISNGNKINEARSISNDDLANQATELAQLIYDIFIEEGGNGKIANEETGED